MRMGYHRKKQGWIVGQLSFRNYNRTGEQDMGNMATQQEVGPAPIAAYLRTLVAEVTANIEAAGLRVPAQNENNQLIISIVSSAIAQIIEAKNSGQSTNIDTDLANRYS